MSYTLPEPVVETPQVTWDTPNLLLAVTEVAGKPVTTIRRGGSEQLTMTTRYEWALEREDESAQVFTIRATNKLNLGELGATPAQIINDAVQFGDTQLIATAPTTTEYLAQIGKETLIHFDCSIDSMETRRAKKSVFKIKRCTIVLP